MGYFEELSDKFKVLKDMDGVTTEYVETLLGALRNIPNDSVYQTTLRKIGSVRTLSIDENKFYGTDENSKTVFSFSKEEVERDSSCDQESAFNSVW